MMRRSFFIVFCACSSLLFTAEQEEFCFGQKHLRLGVRYTTPKGIGYQPGYTTLQGFFAAPRWLRGAWLPFLDMRGHLFDSGRGAANVGLGLRYLSGSRVWGANLYYDYRSARRHHYHQLAPGLESLGKFWDFRINGYFPFGNADRSTPYQNSASFEGNQLIVRYSQRFAMRGANAEAGLHVDHLKAAPFYFAAGPYYLTAMGRTAWGGQLRARVDLLYRYLRIEGNTSYDRIFKWIGQAQISLNIAFGKKIKAAKRSDSSCSLLSSLCTRAVQDVDRFEIIPEVKRRVETPAINPATGEPWEF